jgi:seryl-tRNA synthetase|tara:strand:- start:8602 stop:9900 length:1299 start_codon:yes stop_codon:yes gene_type:complete
MIDIKLIRENSDLVKKNIKKKFQNEKLVLVDKVKKLDEDWRGLKYKVDKLRADRNKISEEINSAKKSKDEKLAKKLIKDAKEIPGKIETIEKKSKKLFEEINRIMLQIPNIIHKSVPIGKDENESPEIRKWGKIEKKNFKLMSHGELAENLGIADFDAGRSNSGQGFNYLIGDLALLDHALQRYGFDVLMEKGFTPIVPPMVLNFETLLGALNGLEDFEEVVYKVEKENLYLIGTAEHALVSLNKNKTLNKKDFPIKICAVTPCFRKEIGSRGVDTKGLFRMHQFNKVEQVVITDPENAYGLLEEMQKITEGLFKNLKIPYRVIEICSGDLGAKFAKQYDIEAWFPRQNKYAEVTSAGSTTDFQARALNIKYLDKSERKYPHLLNNTMVATSRVMVAILENFQQKDGSIKIPKLLWPYMNGKKKIEVNKNKK